MTSGIKDVIERAVKTFIFAFAGSFAIPVATDIHDWHAWYAAVIAAVAAGIGAVINIGLVKFGPNKEIASASLLKQK